MSETAHAASASVPHPTAKQIVKGIRSLGDLFRAVPENLQRLARNDEARKIGAVKHFMKALVTLENGQMFQIDMHDLLLTAIE